MNPIDENTIKQCNDCASKGLKYSQTNGRAQVMISEDYMQEAHNGMTYMQQASALAEMMAKGEFGTGISNGSPEIKERAYSALNNTIELVEKPEPTPISATSVRIRSNNGTFVDLGFGELLGGDLHAGRNTDLRRRNIQFQGAPDIGLDRPQVSDTYEDCWDAALAWISAVKQEIQEGDGSDAEKRARTAHAIELFLNWLALCKLVHNNGIGSENQDKLIEGLKEALRNQFFHPENPSDWPLVVEEEDVDQEVSSWSDAKKSKTDEDGRPVKETLPCPHRLRITDDDFKQIHLCHFNYTFILKRKSVLGKVETDALTDTYREAVVRTFKWMTDLEPQMCNPPYGPSPHSKSGFGRVLLKKIRPFFDCRSPCRPQVNFEMVKVTGEWITPKNLPDDEVWKEFYSDPVYVQPSPYPKWTRAEDGNWELEIPIVISQWFLLTGQVRYVVECVR